MSSQHDILEFEIQQGSLMITPCPFKSNIYINSNACEFCKHYKGFEKMWSSIRCSYTKDHKDDKV